MRQANILDPISSELSPRVFNDPGASEPVLKPHIADFIKHHIYSALEANGYAKPHEWLKLYLTGSLTTYQYSEDSDCDVSLFIDAEVLPEWSRAEMIGVMVGQVDGTKIPGTPYPLQDFVVAKHILPADLYRPGLRAGWSIDEQRWLTPPDHAQTMDVEHQENGYYVIALMAADKMERLLRYEPDKAVMYWHQIHKKRMRDQTAGKGDYSESNVIYKFLNNRGIFPKIAEVSGEHIGAWTQRGQENDWAQQRDNARWDNEYSHGRDMQWSPISQRPGQQWLQQYHDQSYNRLMNDDQADTSDYEKWLEWYYRQVQNLGYSPYEFGLKSEPHVGAALSGEHIAQITWPDSSTFNAPVRQQENPRQWSLGHPGKGFILQDGAVHTWNTEHMEPTHAQEETRRNMASGYGIAPVKRGSEFHIEPTGRVWQYGQGRSLDADDQQAIQRTPTLWTGDAALPLVESDPFGHAIRLMGSVEEHQALLDQNAGQNLQGLPGPVNVGGYGALQFHSHGPMQQMATSYNAANGLGVHPTNYVKVNPNNSRAIAQEYDQMEHNPQDPQVAAAYEALAQETRAQYDHAVNNGYKFDFYPPDRDPYPNSPREAVLDLHHNKHMYVYPTASGFGSDEAQDHPLMGDTGLKWSGQPVYHNDLFRAIHDFYGHAKEGLGFRADGEDNAFRQHQAMFSPLAQRALTSETRGQNSWVNYGPYGEHNQTATSDTIFAPQKAGLMPDWTSDPDLHANQPYTSAAYYEGIVRDGGRYPPTHDYDEPVGDWGLLS